MTDFRDRARRYHGAIHDALIKEWDPIGVGGEPEAQDEYDGYVPAVYRLLISRASEDEIFDYLWQLETEHMGLCGNRQRTRAFAARLLRLIDEAENMMP